MYSLSHTVWWSGFSFPLAQPRTCNRDIRVIWVHSSLFWGNTRSPIFSCSTFPYSFSCLKFASRERGLWSHVTLNNLGALSALAWSLRGEGEAQHPLVRDPAALWNSFYRWCGWLSELEGLCTQRWPTAKQNPTQSGSEQSYGDKYPELWFCWGIYGRLTQEENTCFSKLVAYSFWMETRSN